MTNPTGKKILVFDPGESTGWVSITADGHLVGGTAVRDHTKVAALIKAFEPDVVVFERFNLYPGMAKSLSWNSFYPCEVIGVIKYLCMTWSIRQVQQAPGIKKYSGGLDEDWIELRKRCTCTEHTKDAFLHLKYFFRNLPKDL